MSVDGRMLTEEEWAKVEPLIPKWSKNPKGRQPTAYDRLTFEAILRC